MDRNTIKPFPISGARLNLIWTLLFNFGVWKKIVIGIWRCVSRPVITCLTPGPSTPGLPSQNFLSVLRLRCACRVQQLLALLCMKEACMSSAYCSRMVCRRPGLCSLHEPIQGKLCSQNFENDKGHEIFYKHKPFVMWVSVKNILTLQ